MSYVAQGDVTFQRFTLIFGENGRGKTTLCAILRSVSMSTPAFIVGRTTLGSTNRPEVQLLMESPSTPIVPNNSQSDIERQI